jgi:hypothetical protein
MVVSAAGLFTRRPTVEGWFLYARYCGAAAHLGKNLADLLPGVAAQGRERRASARARSWDWAPALEQSFMA